MIRLAHIVATYAPALLAQHGHPLLPSQKAALIAFQTCRSHMSPRMQLSCDDCQTSSYLPHSCGHRHCPHCQAHESQRWINQQLQKSIPGNYFMLTFTLPAQFRILAWQHQRILYDLITRCAWETVNTFSQNDNKLRGSAGAVTVLHTHNRRLDYHPAKRIPDRLGSRLQSCWHWTARTDLPWALSVSGCDTGERHPLRSAWAGHLPLPEQPNQTNSNPHLEWRRIPATDTATHLAKRLPSRPQLWLSASQQSIAYPATADPPATTAQSAPSATQTSDTLPMLRWGDEDNTYPYQSTTASCQPNYVSPQSRWHRVGDHALNQPTPPTCQTWQVGSCSP